MGSRTNNATANSDPKWYLVKELQQVTAWVIYNHLQSASSAKKKALEDLFFSKYHGLPKTDNNIAFAWQLTAGFSVFSRIVLKDSSQNGLDGKSVHFFKLHPQCVPGSERSVTIGDGPTVDIRYEHLEKATQKGVELINGRSLLRLAKATSAILRKADAYAKQFLDPDGNYPSGKGVDDLLDHVMSELLREKMSGTLEGGDDDDLPVATLTQGVQARAAEAKENEVAKWSNKLLPFAGWVSVALFVSGGLVREQLKDKLPLLMTGDYHPKEKQKHSRSAARKKQKEETKNASRKTNNNTDSRRQNSGDSVRDGLLATVVSLMENKQEHSSSLEVVEEARDNLLAAQTNLNFIADFIRMQSDLKKVKDGDENPVIKRELDRYQVGLRKCERLEVELRDAISNHRKRVAEASVKFRENSKVARRSIGSVPSVVELSSTDDACSFATSMSKKSQSQSQSSTLKASLSWQQEDEEEESQGQSQSFCSKLPRVSEVLPKLPLDDDEVSVDNNEVETLAPPCKTQHSDTSID